MDKIIKNPKGQLDEVREEIESDKEDALAEDEEEEEGKVNKSFLTVKSIEE